MLAYELRRLRMYAELKKKKAGNKVYETTLFNSDIPRRDRRSRRNWGIRSDTCSLKIPESFVCWPTDVKMGALKRVLTNPSSRLEALQGYVYYDNPNFESHYFP